MLKRKTKFDPYSYLRNITKQQNIDQKVEELARAYVQAELKIYNYPAIDSELTVDLLINYYQKDPRLVYRGVLKQEFIKLVEDLGCINGLTYLHRLSQIHPVITKFKFAKALAEDQLLIPHLNEVFQSRKILQPVKHRGFIFSSRSLQLICRNLKAEELHKFKSNMVYLTLNQLV